MRHLLKRSALALALLMGLVMTPALRAEKVERTGAETEKKSAEKSVEKSAEKTEAGGEHMRPLLDFQPAEAIWIVIIFCILLAILYKTAWKNVLAGLNAREERIRKDIADAEAARAKSEALLAEHQAQLAGAEQKVREMMQAAATEGERIAAQIRTHAQNDADAARERAGKDIDAAKRQAIQDIYAQAANLSTSIAEKILRRNLNADDQRDLVNRSLEELQSVN
jgi:F-type H+-transporting ATPase subunit b